jgi:hypothetical protein
MSWDLFEMGDPLVSPRREHGDPTEFGAQETSAVRGEYRY